MTFILKILALASFYVVLQIVSKIITDRRCVDADILRKFMTRSLKKSKRDQVIAHLGLCQKCQDLLHEINDKDYERSQDIDDDHYDNIVDIEDHLIDE